MTEIKKRIKNPILQLFEYAFVVLVVLNFRSMWLHSPDYDFINTKRLVCSIAIIGLICVFLKRRIRFKEFMKALLISVILTVYLGFHMIIRKYSLREELYFLILCIVMILYNSACNDKKYGFYTKFNNIIFLITVISLLFWLFGTVIGILQPTGVIYTTWTSNTVSNELKPVKTYYDIYYVAQTYGMNKALGITTNLDIIRNTGFFTEAPMFSFVLVLALLVELFKKRKL
ncbi:hypothetical protein UYO_3104 [Lachnospiraceae bacterium JC7]|nr:hypothetical protein UYO_3104 [Lachnospiraceae bacterium JC7]